MSDIPLGFSTGPVSPTIQEQIKAVVLGIDKTLEESKAYLGALSKSQKTMVSKIGKMSTDVSSILEKMTVQFREAESRNVDRDKDTEQSRDQDRKERYEDRKKTEEFREGTTEWFDRQIKIQKDMLDKYDTIIDSNLENIDWSRKHYNTLTKDVIRPIAKDTDKQYTKRIRQHANSHFFEALGDHLIKASGVGAFLGHSQNGPSSFANRDRKQRESIFKSENENFQDRSSSDVYNYMTGTDPKKSQPYASVLRELKELKRLKAGYIPEESKEENKPESHSKPQTQTANQPDTAIRDLSSYEGRGLQTNHQSETHIPPAMATGADPSILKEAMERTKSYDRSAMLRLPFIYGGPALFLAGKMEEIWGKDEANGKGKDSNLVTGKGVLGEAFDLAKDALLLNAGKMLANMAKFAKDFGKNAMDFGKNLFKLSPSVLELGAKFLKFNAITTAVILTIEAVGVNIERTKKQREALINNMPKAMKDKIMGLDGMKGRELEDLSPEALKTAYQLSGTPLPMTGDKEVDYNMKNLPIGGGIFDLGDGGMIANGFRGVAKDNIAKLREKYSKLLGKSHKVVRTGSGADSVLMVDGELIPKTDEGMIMQMIKDKNQTFGIAPDQKNNPDIYKFHKGGTVPGAPGTEVPAVLMSGEHVQTADQQATIAQLLRDLLAQSKEHTSELKRNTKVTEDKELKVAIPPSTNSINHTVGAF